ncbi:MAG TPA: hypothetical protein VKR56_02870 [Candidatus Cybelea sp.]|nr:hypothetical protein [Candidatus Cybelea sp.]
MPRAKSDQKSKEQRATTLAVLMKRAKNLEAAAAEFADAPDEGDGKPAKRLRLEYERQAEALLDDLSPLLDILARTGTLVTSYIPDVYEKRGGDESGADSDEDWRTYLAVEADFGQRLDATAYELIASRIGDLSEPPPPLIRAGQDEDFGPFHPAVFLRVPIVGHVVLEEAWQHDGDDIRVIHTRPILADRSNVEFVSQDFNIIGFQPTGVPMVAVYGTLDATADLREYPWDIETLLAEDVIELLGYDYPDSGIDWRARLFQVREEHASEDEQEQDMGVYLRGEYRKLPKLELPPSDGGQNEKE